jgi:hypothetical protein
MKVAHRLHAPAPEPARNTGGSPQEGRSAARPAPTRAAGITTRTERRAASHSLRALGTRRLRTSHCRVPSRGRGRVADLRANLAGSQRRPSLDRRSQQVVRQVPCQPRRDQRELRDPTRRGGTPPPPRPGGPASSSINPAPSSSTSARAGSRDSNRPEPRGRGARDRRRTDERARGSCAHSRHNARRGGGIPRATGNPRTGRVDSTNVGRRLDHHP